MRSIPLILGIIIMGVLASVLIIGTSENPMQVLTGQRQYVEIADAAGFVNSEPFKLADYVGEKVILVDFMTYSCINCQRTFPHVVSWYEQYKDDGFIVVGIHTPEFAFEKDKENVAKAMQEAGINYPVVLDNDYGTWRAYGNNYWPRKYLIDIHGNIVYDHIGEGNYDETEAKIRELLAGRAEKLGESLDLGDPSDVPEVDVSARSPETYFGSLRNEYLESGRSGVNGVQIFSREDNPSANALYLSGEWDIQDEYAESRGGSVMYRYSAKKVYIVATSEEAIRVRIVQDGVPVSSARGADVGEDGYVTVREDRLYELINNAGPGTHTLEIQAPRGFRAFAFTFG